MHSDKYLCPKTSGKTNCKMNTNITNCNNQNCPAHSQFSTENHDVSQSYNNEIHTPCFNASSTGCTTHPFARPCPQGRREERLENLVVKLTGAEQTILAKEKIIDLLQSQLNQLKQRNLKSIDEAQEVFLKFGLTQQRLDVSEQKCAKYDKEIHRLQIERSSQLEQEKMALRFKEDADRWKKQYEDLLGKITASTENSSSKAADELNWRQSLQNEVTKAVSILTENSQTVINSLEKQNKKLEVFIEKLQDELEHSEGRELYLRNELEGIQNKHAKASSQSAINKQESDKSYEERIKEMKHNNDALLAELENVTKKYNDRQQEYDCNLNALEKQIQSLKCSKDYDMLQTELDEKSKIIKILEANLSRSEIQISQMKEKFIQSEALGKKLTLSLKNMESAFAVEKNRNDALKLQTDKMRNLKEMLDKEINKNNLITEDFQNIKSRLEIELNTNKQLTKQRDDLENDIAKIKIHFENTNSIHETKISTLERQIQAFINEKDEIIETNVNLETKLNKSYRDLQFANEYQQELIELEAKYKLLSKENLNLKDSLLKKDTDISALDATIKELQTQICSLSSTMKCECKKYKDGMENCKKEHFELLAKFTLEKKHLEKKIQQLETEYMNLQKQVVDANSKLSTSITESSNVIIIQKPTNCSDCPTPTSKRDDGSLYTEDCTNFDCQDYEDCQKSEDIPNPENCSNSEDCQNPKDCPSCKQREEEQIVKKVHIIEKKVISLSETLCKNDDKAASLPNLEAIKQNNDYDLTHGPQCVSVISKSFSLDDKTRDKNCSKTPGSTSSSVTNDMSLRKCDGRWETQLEVIQRLRNELTDVLSNLDIKNTINSKECMSSQCTNHFKLVADSLQRQLNDLNVKSAEESGKCYKLKAELQEIKGDMIGKDQMSEEVKKLRRELYKHKVESVQEIEKARIRKEAEILAVQYELREKFLANKLTLLADLAEVQTALKMKSSPHMQLKEKCDQLITDITINQEARKKKIQEIMHQTDSLQSINLEKGLRDIFQPGQVPKEQTSEVTEETTVPGETLSNVRAKLNSTIEKHRLDTDSVPKPSHLGDGDNEEKYLLK